MPSASSRVLRYACCPPSCEAISRLAFRRYPLPIRPARRRRWTTRPGSADMRVLLIEDDEDDYFLTKSSSSLDIFGKSISRWNGSQLGSPALRTRARRRA